MRREKKDRWERYKGSIHLIPGEVEDEIDKIEGDLYIDDVQIRFSFVRQDQLSGYLFRGSMRIISPEDGKLLRVPSRGKNTSKLAKEAIYTNSTDLETVKVHVLDRAERLVTKYAEAIRRAENIHIVPSTITPRQAYSRYAQRFLADQYKGKKANEKMNMLQAFYSGLPAQPMEKFSRNAIQDYIKQRGFGKEMVRFAERFWTYCIRQGYCTGGNPIPSEQRERKSAAALQRELLKEDVLTIQEQNELVDLLQQSASGHDCGVALMLSGFAAEATYDLIWKQVLLDDPREDFVLIGQFLDEFVGATHDYTRPCIPQCAELLKKRYRTLREQYSEAALRNMYVVGGEKKLSPGELSKYMAMRLQQVTGETVSAAKARKLLNDTYIRNVAVRCGMSSDLGTFNFLCGRSLGRDTTSANYTSFTSPEARERLYTILKVLQTERELPRADILQPLEDGRSQYVFTPLTTAQTAGSSLTFSILPGQSPSDIFIHADHGAKVVVRAYKME